MTKTSLISEGSEIGYGSVVFCPETKLIYNVLKLNGNKLLCEQIPTTLEEKKVKPEQILITIEQVVPISKLIDCYFNLNNIYK